MLGGVRESLPQTLANLDVVAGLLLRYAPASAEPTYLLQLRARSVDEGATWGIPGGAIKEGESLMS